MIILISNDNGIDEDIKWKRPTSKVYLIRVLRSKGENNMSQYYSFRRVRIVRNIIFFFPRDIYSKLNQFVTYDIMKMIFENKSYNKNVQSRFVHKM